MRAGRARRPPAPLYGGGPGPPLDRAPLGRGPARRGPASGPAHAHEKHPRRHGVLGPAAATRLVAPCRRAPKCTSLLINVFLMLYLLVLLPNLYRPCLP